MALKDDAPANVREIYENLDTYDLGDEYEGLDDGQKELFDRLTNCQCVTCGNDLGETAIVVVAHPGIVASFCCGQCHSDIHVVGFLQEVHHDISQQIDFRSGEGGN